LGTLSGTFMASLFITHENDTPLAKKILESVVTDQQRTEFLHAVSWMCIKIVKYLPIHTVFCDLVNYKSYL